MDIEIRKALSCDIKSIKKLLSSYCLDTEDVEKNLEEFIVAVSGDKVTGCACLVTDGIVELRSIAVLPHHRNRGTGSKLVESILERARKLADTVYLRTTAPVFFEKKGFVRLSGDQKKTIWKDCAECDKFDACKQAMMKFNIEQIDHRKNSIVDRYG